MDTNLKDLQGSGMNLVPMVDPAPDRGGVDILAAARARKYAVSAFEVWNMESTRVRYKYSYSRSCTDGIITVLVSRVELLGSKSISSTGFLGKAWGF